MPDDDDAAAPAWKGRVMRGGDWTDPEDRSGAARADRVVTVRMTEAELAELDTQIGRLGMKRNRALRIAARRIGGFVEADAAQVAALRDVARRLVEVARDINRIAKAGEESGGPDFRAFMEARATLGRELAAAQAGTQAVLDLAARREDGLARLAKAAGE
jgi:type IV secretion system T-DNA border endonuclease VirD1